MSSSYNPPPDTPELEPSLPEVQLPVTPRENPVWTVPDVMLMALVAFISLLVFTMLSFFTARNLPGLSRYSATDLAKSPLVLLPPETLAYLATFGFMVFLVRRRSWEPFWRQVKWNWPPNFFLLGGTGVLLAILAESSSRFLPIPKSLPIDEYFRDRSSAYFMMVFGITVAPFFEELFFRGFLYPALFRPLKFWGALIVNSFLFALLHQEQLAHAWAPLFMLFIIGMVLTWVRARMQSVAASFLVHAFYNATLFATLFIGTGGFRHMERMG